MLPSSLLLLLTAPLALASQQAPLQSAGARSTTLIDVLVSDPDYSSLLRLVQVARLVPTLNRLNGSTFFAPTNDAIKRHTGKSALWQQALAGTLLEDNTHEQLRQHLFYHLLNYSIFDLPSTQAPVFHETLHFPRKPPETPSPLPPPGPPWMPLPGGSLGGLAQRVRVATRDSKKWVGVDAVGAGGVAIAKTGVNASNGIVYGVADVVPLPGELQSIIDDHPSLAYLSKLLPPKVQQDLHDSEAMSLFLPVDSSWQVLHPIDRLYLESEFAEEDLSNILGMHTLDAKEVKYADKLKSGKTYPTLYGNKLEFKRSDDQTTVASSEVVQSDIYAANGVVHLVKDLLIPPGALKRTPEKYLLALNCTGFVRMLHSVNLASLINDTDTAYTILAPRDDVLGVFGDPDDLPAPGSPELARMLQYHFIPGRWTQEQLKDGMLINTVLRPDGLSGGAQVLGVTVEKKKKDTDISFGGASIIGEPVDLNGTIIYLVSRPLTPPADPLNEALQNLHFSTFLAAVYSTSLADKLRSWSRTTFLVPNNAAFEELQLVSAYLLMSSAKSDLENVIQHHALQGVYYMNELLNGTAQTYSTLEGTDVRLARSNGSATVAPSGGWSGMVGSLEGATDMLTETGAIHEISSLLIPRTVDLTVAKLAKAAKGNTMAGLVSRAGFDWVLAGNDPPADSEWAPLRGAAWVLLCPTDDAFKGVNLTALHDDAGALRALVAQHVVPAPAGAAAGSAPLALADDARVSTLRSVDSAYGDLAFRFAGPDTGFVVGVRGARGDGASGARVLAWGRASAGSGSGAGGGGLLQIDRVLLPYAPPWYVAVGAPAALALGGTAAIAAFWYAVWRVWRRDTTEATYEPLGGFAREDDD